MLFATCIFLDPYTWSALQERFERPISNEVLRDVYDGEGYKQQDQFLSQQGNISLLLNTDGVAISGRPKCPSGLCGQ